MVSGGFAPEDLAVVYLQEDVSIFVAIYVIKVDFSEAADIISDVVEKMESEGAKVGWLVRNQDVDH